MERQQLKTDRVLLVGPSGLPVQEFLEMDIAIALLY